MNSHWKTFTDLSLDEAPNKELAILQEYLCRKSFDQIGAWAAAIVAEADGHPLISELLHVDEDVLGVYRPRTGHRMSQTGEIEIFWAAIGLVSALNGWDLADLTLIILAHELSHAYTHCGYDADGVQWEGFEEVEPKILEGLAQYFTEIVVARMRSLRPNAHCVFESLAQLQTDMYRTHEAWASSGITSEHVRAALLESRSAQVKKYEEFEKLLFAAQQRNKRERWVMPIQPPS